jgi:hypothetical protein
VPLDSTICWSSLQTAVGLNRSANLLENMPLCRSDLCTAPNCSRGTVGEKSLLKARWDEQQRVEVTDSVTVHLTAVHTRNSIFREPPFAFKESIVIGNPWPVSNQLSINFYFLLYSTYASVAVKLQWISFVTADPLKFVELNQTEVFRFCSFPQENYSC